AREKIYKKFSKYEYLGLTLFVGIPLPITGIWTGSLGAWILQLERKKVFPSLFFGVLIAGIIVSIILFFGLYSLKFFKIFLGRYF
ncbi:MAG: small multi-drug export protein, partial [Exilispira sp.]